MLVRYLRTGGRGRPPDDERLEVADDGGFTLHRRVAERCVGDFAGSIGAAQLSALRDALDGVPSGEVKRQPSVPGVLEIVETPGASASFGYEDGAPAEWASAVDLLETLLEELTDEANATAAVALDVADGGATVSLRPIGDRIDVETSAARATADFFSEYQEHMRTQHGSFAAGDRVATFDPPITFTPEETVMVRVELSLVRPGSPAESVVLSATLGRGWDDDEDDED